MVINVLSLLYNYKQTLILTTMKTKTESLKASFHAETKAGLFMFAVLLSLLMILISAL